MYFRRAATKLAMGFLPRRFKVRNILIKKPWVNAPLAAAVAVHDLADQYHRADFAHAMVGGCRDHRMGKQAKQRGFFFVCSVMYTVDLKIG